VISYSLAHFNYGAIAALCWVTGLYFFGFWRKTHDRFFGYFGLAFWLLGAGRVALSITGSGADAPRAVYVMRLVAYLIFLIAIIDKNRSNARDRV
jgi:uncharacterized membrane protein